MTALERAEEIVLRLQILMDSGCPISSKGLIRAIHQSIIEYSNAELERRMVAEPPARKVAAAICEIKSRCPGNAEVWKIANRALKALEGDDV